eukprot:1283512-Pleurochrysis_carterae.AAC.2
MTRTISKQVERLHSTNRHREAQHNQQRNSAYQRTPLAWEPSARVVTASVVGRHVTWDAVRQVLKNENLLRALHVVEFVREDEREPIFLVLIDGGLWRLGVDGDARGRVDLAVHRRRWRLVVVRQRER